MVNKILLKLFGVRLVNSQCGEDLIIDSMIPLQKNGFYVDVGANHPIKYNNTFLFYKKGWRGINIEPNYSRMWLFKLIRRKDINLNIGIGAVKSDLIFYIFKDSTLSTFDKKAAERYVAMGHKLQGTKNVPVLPLSEVLEKYSNVTKIDILSIDTEGLDMEVLKSNDWNRFKPKFIIIETLEYERGKSGNKIDQPFNTYMTSIGYEKIADTFINSIYQSVR